MTEIIKSLLDPQRLELIIYIMLIVLYWKGRITEGQLYAEQAKVKGIINGTKKDIQLMSKNIAAKEALNPLTMVFDALNYVPVVNTKIPLINQSVPDLAKGVVQTILTPPVALLSDLLFNMPFFGTNLKK